MKDTKGREFDILISSEDSGMHEFRVTEEEFSEIKKDLFKFLTEKFPDWVAYKKWSDDPSPWQCMGITKAGKRCRNRSLSDCNGYEYYTPGRSEYCEIHQSTQEKTNA